ncbi:hypothetical protein OUZ56_006517 [Daphnia magna]|uniref:Uncharacterized protein n=1 Tax=Daphnia magna TaxID=35525 RepID=A0ABQ9YVW2_9CRUS|nr:hypothetical protein OUZ56_006517 [Daphnia magna]
MLVLILSRPATVAPYPLNDRVGPTPILKETDTRDFNNVWELQTFATRWRTSEVGSPGLAMEKSRLSRKTTKATTTIPTPSDATTANTTTASATTSNTTTANATPSNAIASNATRSNATTSNATTSNVTTVQRPTSRVPRPKFKD